MPPQGPSHPLTVLSQPGLGPAMAELLITPSHVIHSLCRGTNSGSSRKWPGFPITGRWRRRRNDEFVSGLSALTLSLGLTNYDSKNTLTVPKYCGLGKRYLDNLSVTFRLQKSRVCVGRLNWNSGIWQAHRRDENYWRNLDYRTWREEITRVS